MEEFGMNFILPVFSIKLDNIQSVFFHKAKEWNARHVFGLFAGYESLTKDRCFDLFTEYEFPTGDRWILRCVFDLFTGYEFLTKDGWISSYAFDLFTGVWISDERWMIYNTCISATEVLLSTMAHLPQSKIWPITHWIWLRSIITLV